MTTNQDTITAAIRAESVVTFMYSGNHYAPFVRTVSPYELSEDGDTFLGWDHDREALRRFDLTKVTGSVQVAQAVYVKPIEKGSE